MDKREQIQQFYLLQVNDALFPIGGYSHSQGLETYIQKGTVHDEKTAGEYIRNKLGWSLLYTDFLAVRLAYERAKEEDLEALNRLEDLLEVIRIPMEQREASRKMGSRFAKTIARLSIEKTEIWEQYLEARRQKSIAHCCVYGVFCASLNLPLQEVLAHYLYAQTSAMVTNCVKSIPLSQSVGQKLLCGCYELFPELIETVMRLSEENLGLSAPGFDIRGIQHERLYSRLYMS